jgi:hypothetical protein
MTDTPCGRCAGTGRIAAFSHVHGGVCFGCDGTGVGDAPSAPPTVLKVDDSAERDAWVADWVAASPVGDIVARNIDIGWVAELVALVRNGHSVDDLLPDLPGYLFGEGREDDAYAARSLLA